jgi:hypothetical protein
VIPAAFQVYFVSLFVVYLEFALLWSILRQPFTVKTAYRILDCPEAIL